MRRIFVLPALLTGVLFAQDMPFTVQLTTPLSTSRNRKGDAVTAQVMDPAQFRGDTVQGQVTQSKPGGKFRGQAVLNFNFDTLQHAGMAVPISSSITTIFNSKGQANVDEEGRVVHSSSSNIAKAAAGTGLGALVGGLAGGGRGAAIGAAVGAGASIMLIEVAAEGPNVEFAPGARIGLSVKARSGPELPSLAANGPSAAPSYPAASTRSAQPVANAAAPAAPALGGQPQFSTIRIDFVPGERTIFFDDFSDMAQDEPPPHWKIREKPVELRIAGNVRELYSQDGTALESPTFTVPQNFTFELEWTGEGETWWSFRDKDDHECLHANVRGEPSGQDANASIEAVGQGTLGDGGIKTDTTQPVKFALWAQQGRVRAYLNGQRLVDVNQVSFCSITHVDAHIAGYRPNGIRLVRIAESAPDFSAMIASSGRYVTHGIYFDTDSDHLRTESAPVLKLVAQGLQKNPNLKLQIQGHTDSSGDAQHNQDLSQRRAEAVRTVLVAQFGIDAGRLTSAGAGASKPVASNDTADGRAQNRRVEFVKQ